MQTGSSLSTTSFVLHAPSAAQTEESIALLWDRPLKDDVGQYEILLNGELAATTGRTTHTLSGLTPAKRYAVQIRAHHPSGARYESNTVEVSTRRASEIIDITAFGAIADGKTINTAAIQAAIDACPSGGTVLIPNGTFRTGAIYLKSDMTLHLDAGAILLGSDNTADFPLMTYRWEGREWLCYSSLINTRPAEGERLKNIAITGPGKIDANGSALRKQQIAENAGKPGRAVCLRNVDGLYLQGITVRQSPAWCVHLIYCNNVSVNGISVHTRFDENGKHYEGIANGDGLNPDSCRDVYIFDCHIASQDDCIAIKSGRDEEGRAVAIPSENIRVSNCRFTYGFGVAVGSEMSGGVRNVLVENCVFENTFSIAAIKAPRGRGSVIENITYRDCTLINRCEDHHDCRWFRGAIYVDNFYSVEEFDPNEAQPIGDGTPAIRNVTFQNLTVDSVGGNAIYLTGLPESPLENIRLLNVQAVGKHGFIANNIRGLTLEKVSVEAREGKAMRFANVR